MPVTSQTAEHGPCLLPPGIRGPLLRPHQCSPDVRPLPSHSRLPWARVHLDSTPRDIGRIPGPAAVDSVLYFFAGQRLHELPEATCCSCHLGLPSPAMGFLRATGEGQAPEKCALQSHVTQSHSSTPLCCVLWVRRWLSLGHQTRVSPTGGGGPWESGCHTGGNDSSTLSLNLSSAVALSVLAATWERDSAQNTHAGADHTPALKPSTKPITGAGVLGLWSQGHHFCAGNSHWTVLSHPLDTQTTQVVPRSLCVLSGGNRWGWLSSVSFQVVISRGSCPLCPVTW